MSTVISRRRNTSVGVGQFFATLDVVPEAVIVEPPGNWVLWVGAADGRWSPMGANTLKESVVRQNIEAAVRSDPQRLLGYGPDYPEAQASAPQWIFDGTAWAQPQGAIFLVPKAGASQAAPLPPGRMTIPPKPGRMKIPPKPKTPIQPEPAPGSKIVIGWTKMSATVQVPKQSSYSYSVHIYENGLFEGVALLPELVGLSRMKVVVDYPSKGPYKVHVGDQLRAGGYVIVKVENPTYSAKPLDEIQIIGIKN